jgi:ATP-dependent exoDNAse (exonuclease V) alpha subunit
VAYAITVHKSQGLTVSRAVLDISEKDFSSGLTYVVISCVKMLAGILFDNVFDFEWFRPGHSERALMRLADITRQASQHVSKSIYNEVKKLISTFVFT